MAKKPRKIYEQEALVAAFAQHSISARNTFHPQQWSSGTEPADIVIVVGKALLLINTHASTTNYFETMIAHNIIQARKRIEEWKTGKQIRGRNDWREFVIEWKDIAYIHVISVIDGPHAACADHPLAGLNMDIKVTLCTTLTSRVLHDLALKGGGARDLVTVCRALVGQSTVTEAETMNMIQARYTSLKNQAMKLAPREPKRFGKAIVKGKSVDWFDEFRMKFVGTRTSGSEVTDLLSDLDWTDIFPAIAFIIESICQLEEMPLLQQKRTEVFGSVTRLRVLVGFIEDLGRHVPNASDRMDGEGTSILFIVILSNFGIQEVIAVSPVAPATATALSLSF